MNQNAAARHRLDRRLDAAIAVLQADDERLEQLAARAGITGRPHKSVLIMLLYWHLVEQPL